MATPGRVGKLGGFLAVLAAGVASAQTLDDAARTTAEAQMLATDAARNDARLADVVFVDPQHGWAVGDRGTIWHTEDGGQHWLLQRSGVSCRLRSVSFVDRRHGWAAGGFTHPYSHTSGGVLLFTTDGGNTWIQNNRSMLPALEQVRFIDQKTGWAVGRTSAMYPTGLFLSDSGGQEWRPMQGRKTEGLSAADFLNANTGAVVARSGMAAAVRQGSVQLDAPSRFGLRGATDVKLVAPRFGWLVGQGGLVMMTGDLGASWQTTPGPLPEQAQRFDFQALAVVGPKAWVAGSPGTRVFHSHDAGRSWRALATGQNLPIHALTFLDEQNGWAVGELGTILATTDGGESWTRQRCGGTRAALLGFFAEAKDVPLELFADLSGNDGYLGAVELLGRRDVETEPPGETSEADRVHEALLRVGASSSRTAWRFPLRQPGLKMPTDQILAGWDAANDGPGRGADELQRSLVRRIRVWRPEVLVTHDADTRGDRPLDHLINQAVLRAVELAADPTYAADQITQMGLTPWQVKKVFVTLQPGERGTTNLTTAQLAGRLGRSLAEVSNDAWGLIDREFRTRPESLGFRNLVDRVANGERDLFTGISLQPGGEARRELTELSVGGLDSIRRIAKQTRNVRAILERAHEDTSGGAALIAQAGQLTRDLDSDSSARVLWRLGQQFYQSGKWPAAAEIFQRLADQHPNHPLARPALTWLVQYYCSTEVAWRVEGAQRSMSAQGSGGTPGQYAVRQASTFSIDPLEAENRPELAASLGERIERTLPDLFADPTIRFPLAVADRQRGFPRQADRTYLMFSRSVSSDAWHEAARSERWLDKREGLPIKPLLRCVAASERPLLDGRLDDEVWQKAEQAKLSSRLGDDAQWPAEVMLAHDAEFLYLAVRCGMAPGVDYSSSDEPRPRDPDLTTRDRVELYLDLDRDYTTYFRLTVDHRGWTGDQCWGDSTWNPEWFVAAAVDESGQGWTVEAAIPLDQLSPASPRPKTAWAVGLQRIVPGVGFQSWTQPSAAVVRPEGFGHLMFQ